MAPTFRNDFNVNEDLKKHFKAGIDLDSDDDKEMIQIEDVSEG